MPPKSIPEGNKGILANHVALKAIIHEVRRKAFTGICDMKRRITEVRFDDQFEPMNFEISIKLAKIKRMRRAKIPGIGRYPVINVIIG